MLNAISPASSSTTELQDTYVTRKQHHRMIRTACVAILVTSVGATIPHASIAAGVGCPLSTVARIKRELKELGLLGAVLGDAPRVQRVPEATFDNLFDRITDLLDWLSDLRMYGTGGVVVAEAIAEAHDLLRVIRREGALPLHLTPIRKRLEALEAIGEQLASDTHQVDDSEALHLLDEAIEALGNAISEGKASIAALRSRYSPTN